MSVSKKTRFEVFKRDNFTCVYCGRKPPAVVLECDHINPKSKGGLDEIDNLTTSCFDCNRGKGKNKLTSLPQKVSEKAEIIKEKQAQVEELEKLLKKNKATIRRKAKNVEAVFCEHYPESSFKRRFRVRSLGIFLKKLTCQEVEEAVDIACLKITDDPEKAVKYFCGICWNKIRGNNEAN